MRVERACDAGVWIGQVDEVVDLAERRSHGKREPLLPLV